jgi:hypothetical protein
MNEDELLRLYRRVHAVDEEIPPHYRDAIERASESDRLWFERHPDRHVRLRALIPGEFGPLVDEATVFVVRVDKVRGDTRLRSAISRARGLS